VRHRSTISNLDQKEEPTVTEQVIDVSVYMTGLMFLKAEREGDAAPRAIHVLLPDARKPIAGTPPNERHVPVIQFDWEDLANGDRRPFRKFFDLAGMRQGLWLLDKDKVKILDVISDPLQVDESAVERLPTADNKVSRQWIASPRPIGGPLSLKPGLVPFNQNSKNAALLVASMRLDRGELRPASFASQQGQFVLVQVEGTDTTVPQRALASVVEYRVKVAGNAVRLQAEKFDGTEGQVLELNPRQIQSRDGELQRRVEIWLLNREWDSILRQTPSRPVQQDDENSEYLFLTRLLDRQLPEAERKLDGRFTIADFAKPTDAPTNPFPCDNPVMRMLFFPQASGENTRNAPCSPMFG
jgi:hypothetical protein